MLSLAKARFPMVRYKKMSLQEMNFKEEFEGAICIDALEHVFPEDWPLILHRFREALKPGGVLYFTLDVSATGELEEAYEQAKSQGLPVVFGEVATEVEAAYDKVMALKPGEVPDADLGDKAVYHFHPPEAQVREWLHQERFVIEAESMGIIWYRHFLVRNT
jgi:hypothetical protein